MSNTLKFVSMAVLLSAVMAGNVEASKNPTMSSERTSDDVIDITIRSSVEIPGIPDNTNILRIQHGSGDLFVKPSMIINEFTRLHLLWEIHHSNWRRVADKSKKAFNNHPTLTAVYGQDDKLLWSR